jgi:hypothetical protein
LNTANILAAISLALCCFFFLYFRRYIKRRTSAGELLAEYRTEVHRLIAEIDAATDRDAQLVEERIKTLKSLLGDTDKRIAVYFRELERSRSGEALYTRLGRGIHAALNPPVEAAQPASGPLETAPTQAQPPESGAAGESPAPEIPADGTRLRQTAKTGRKRASLPPAASAVKSRLKEQIVELSAAGLHHAEIASRLDISFTEVELALSLLGHGKAQDVNAQD